MMHLDLFLAEAGTDAILRRSGVDVTVRAAIRQKGDMNELVSGSMQDDLVAIISMTQIQAAGWYAGTTGAAPYVRDTAIPRRGDELFVKGIRYRVESSDVITINNIVVRVNLTIKGNTSGA